MRVALKLLRGPVFRLALGLAGLVGCLLLTVDLSLGLVPRLSQDPSAALRLIAERGTERLVRELEVGDRREVESQMAKLRQDHAELIAIVVRDHSGALMSSSGPHRSPGKAVESDPDLLPISVTLKAGLQQWGTVEFLFHRPPSHSFLVLLYQRSTWIIFATALAMLALIYFYLRRALSYLDPSAVVPDRLRAAFDNLSEGIVLLDGGGRVVLANKALREMTGVRDDALHGRKVIDVLDWQWEGGISEPPWDAVLANGAASTGAVVQVGKAHQYRTGSVNCSPILDTHGKVRGCMVTVADVTEVELANRQLTRALGELNASRQRVEQQNRELEKLAHLDGLSGLLNRRRFFEISRNVITRSQNSHRPLAVMMMDIDHFKTFNDRYGHATGDAVIQSVASCLGRALRTRDVLGRYGGEEFSAVCEGTDEATALIIAERLRASVEKEAGIGVHNGQDLTVTISVGLVVVEAAPAVELADLLKLADEALYRAKKEGRNRVVAH